MNVTFEDRTLFLDGKRMLYWSSGKETDIAHVFPILMAVISPNGQLILSMDDHGLMRLWKDNEKKWDSRPIDGFRTSDIRKLAVPDSQKVILVAKGHEVFCFRMVAGWQGDYGTLERICSFPFSFQIADIEITPEGLLVTEALRTSEATSDGTPATVATPQTKLLPLNFN